MAERAFETALGPVARRTYAALNHEDQAQISRLVAVLEADSYIDGRTKCHFPAEIVPLAVYVSGDWALI